MSHSLETPTRDREQVGSTFTGPATMSTVNTASTSGFSEATLVDPSPVSSTEAKNTPGDNVDTVQESNESIDALAASLDNVTVASGETAIQNGAAASDLQTAGEDGNKEAFILRSSSMEDPFVSNATEEGSANGDPSSPQSTDAHDSAPEAVEETYPVREDRANVQPSNTTAQGLYGPDACVFVANLAQNYSDENLECGVIQAFSRFGNVWVKIRRDSSGMPYAFAQFQTKEAAQAAIAQGRGIIIFGRACRTEVAKVNRAVYLSKLSGGHVTFQLAREVLSPFGAIEELWYPTPTDREVNRLPEGIWVRFHFFDDCRDALASLRDDATYRVEQPRKADGVRANSLYHAQNSSPRRFPQGGLPAAHHYNNVAPEHNQYSVFVGNLPVGCNHEDLLQMFARFGAIVDAQVLYKPMSANPTHLNVFGFVEFTECVAAELAVARGRELFPSYRIERKESRRGSPILRGNFTAGLATPNSWVQAVPRSIPAGAHSHHLTGPVHLVPYATYLTADNNVATYGNGGGSANYAQGTQPYYPTMTQTDSNANGFASSSTQANYAQYYAAQALTQADQSAASAHETSYVWPPASGDNNAGSA